MNLRVLSLLGLMTLSAATQAQAGQVLRPYTLGGKPATAPKETPSLRFVQPDKAVLADWRRHKLEAVSLDLPLPDGSMAHYELEKNVTVHQNSRVRVTGGKVVHADLGLHYFTPKSKDASESAALSLFELAPGQYQLSGMFTHKGKAWVLGPDGDGKPVLFPEAEMPGKNPFECHADELRSLSPARSRGTAVPDAPQALCANSVKLFIEADYRSYYDNHESVAGTVAWINTIWNVCALHYRNVNVPIQVYDTYIHTVPDNYPTTTSQDILPAFADTLQIRNYQGDLGHLMSTRPLGLGGIAYLDVLCNGFYNAGYSDVDLTYQNLPAYSWTVEVCTHEMGHNMGSSHTHWCGWEKSPGVFGPIDSCSACDQVTPGVDCFSPAQIRPRVGTIMSYCHLNASIDPALGFGPLPSQVVYQGYLNASCLTPGASIPGIAIAGVDTACPGQSVQLSVSALTGATYDWTGPSGFHSTAREPIINPFTASKAGDYNVTVTLLGCAAQPLTTKLIANCIGVVPNNNSWLCRGDQTPVSWSASYTPTSGNQFQIEISDAAGNFSATPTVLLTTTSIVKRGTVAVTVPATLGAGSYKLRVRGTNPVQVGEASTGTLNVRAASATPATTGASRTSPGTLTLTAVPPTGAAVRWFADSASSTVLASTNSFTTPSLTTTKTYWAQTVSAKNQSLGIANRTGQTGGFINNPTRGQYFTVLAPMVLDSVRVYNGFGGTINFNISESNSGRVVFTSNAAIPANSSTGNKVKVGAQLAPGSYFINSTGSTGMSSLYRVQYPLDIDGNPTTVLPYPYRISNLATIDSAGVSGLLSTSTYYFYFDWKVRPLVCASAKVPVLAAIQSGCTPPAAPVATGGSVCTGGSISVTATGAPSGYGYRWYANPSGGSPLSGGQAVTYSFSPATTDTLYVGLQSTTDPTCVSARTRVIIRVNPIPAGVTVPEHARCGPGTAVLTASASTQDTVHWLSSTGMLLARGTSFTTPSLSANTTYQVRIRSAAGCTSTATQTLVRINAIPQAPVANGAARCGNGTVTLTATATNGDTIQWLSSTGTLLGRGGSYTTPTLSATTPYQVRSRNAAGCTSTAINVQATVNAAPANPTVTGAARCDAGSVTLHATVTGNDTILWIAPNNAVVGRGTSFTTPVLSSTTTYTAKARSGAGCYSNGASVEATINTVPAAPTLSVHGDTLRSSAAGPHIWILNGIPQGQGGNFLPRPSPGNWQAITLSQPCPSDTSAVFALTPTAAKGTYAAPSLYPNPAEDQLFLHNIQAYQRYALSDILGRPVQQGAVSDHLQVGQLPKGVYFLKLMGNGRETAVLRFEKR